VTIHGKIKFSIRLNNPPEILRAPGTYRANPARTVFNEIEVNIRADSTLDPRIETVKKITNALGVSLVRPPLEG